MAKGDTVTGWGPNDASVYVRRGTNTVLPARIDRLDLATGRAEKWRDIAPADATGVISVYGFRIAPDGQHYAYGYTRLLSTLFLVEGVK